MVSESVLLWLRRATRRVLEEVFEHLATFQCGTPPHSRGRVLEEVFERLAPFQRGTRLAVECAVPLDVATQRHTRVCWDSEHKSQVFLPPGIFATFQQPLLCHGEHPGGLGSCGRGLAAFDWR